VLLGGRRLMDLLLSPSSAQIQLANAGVEQRMNLPARDVLEQDVCPEHLLNLYRIQVAQLARQLVLEASM
jgi:hypothetical protein